VQQLDAEREQLAQKIQLLKVGPKGGTTGRSCPIVAGGCRRLAICIYTCIYILYVYIIIITIIIITIIIIIIVS